MAGTLMLLVVLGLSPSDATARAEMLTRRAIVEYNGGDFDEALVDAKQAYALQPVAGQLYNLAQIHRALHHWEEAAFSFRAYLREQPGAPNRAAVEALIAQMDQNARDRVTAERAPPPPLAVLVLPAAPAPVAAPRLKPPVRAPATPKHARTKIAVSELEAGLQTDPKVAHLVTGLLTAELRKRPSLAVTSQDDIKTLLGFERQKALLGCTDASCLAEIGGALGVDQMLTGSLSRFGESLVLLVRLVDVQKGLALGDVTRRFTGDAEDALLDAIPGVVADLYPSPPLAVPPAAVAPVATVHASGTRSSAPWWLVGTGAVVAAAGGAITGYEFATKEPLSQVTVSQARTANVVAVVGESAVGVGLALLCGGGLWAMLRPARPEAAIP